MAASTEAKGEDCGFRSGESSGEEVVSSGSIVLRFSCSRFGSNDYAVL